MCVFCVGVVSLCFMVKETYTHIMCTHWCHEDGLYTSLNPLRNNPLVEGVNTVESVNTEATTATLAHVGRRLIKTVAVECNVNTHSKMLCNVLSLTLHNYTEGRPVARKAKNVNEHFNYP